MNKPLAFLLFLAFIRGCLYALYLPPWALTDEEQHVHYIQSLAEEGKIPVVGSDYLSDEITRSVLDTKRHARLFFMKIPFPDDQRNWGLEGHSYEGYQPPLFYLLSTPIYLLTPGGMLNKLIALRLWMVLLSLIPVWILYRIIALSVDPASQLPWIAASLLIFIPERTIATSRVSNDVLLEVMAALFILAFVHILMHGLSDRRLLALSILFALGLLTKLSFLGMGVFFLFLLRWYASKDNLLRFLILASLPTLILVTPNLARNLALYGDPTGFQGFAAIAQAEIASWQINFSLSNLWGSLLKTFAHFWVIWWKGGFAIFTRWLIPFYLSLTIVVAAALILGLKTWRGQPTFSPMLRKIMPAFSAAIIVYLLLVLVSYYAEQFPVIQGRFLLPVYLPFISLLVWSLATSRQASLLLFILLGTLIVLDALFLFGNQLRYFYYQSPIVVALDGQPPALWTAKIKLVLQTFFADQQRFQPWVYLGLLGAYLAGLLAWLGQTFVILKNNPSATHTAHAR